MLKYEVALINVFWNINDINTRHFDSISEQNEYFDTMTGGYFTPLFNFNMGDNIETAIIYRDTSGRDISELVKCNYLVLHRKNEENEVIERRYYFAMVEQDSGNQVRVTLSLDDIQTNYFRYKNMIAPCFINRTHLDRFREIDENNVEFNLEPGSPLFDVESDDLPKRLTSRIKLEFNQTNQSEINEWLKNNVAYWVYVFCDRFHRYKVYNININSPELVDTSDGLTSLLPDNLQDIGCVVYPVMKTTNKLYVTHNISETIDDEEVIIPRNIDISSIGMGFFRENNSNSSYLFTSKVSIICPFNNIYDYSISNNNLYINGTSVGNFNLVAGDIRCIETDFNNSVGLLTRVKYLSMGNNESDEYILSNQFQFEKSSIINGVRNINYEPKLLSQNYTELQLKSSAGESFIYDKQKMGQSTLKFYYTEPIQPEVTKYYCRLKSPTGLYSEGTDKNYLGLVGSNDTNISIANDQYSNFIANNKNYNLQTEVGFKLGMVSSAVKLTKKDYQGAGETAGSTLMNTFNRLVTLDNLKASPGMLSNAMSNILFNMTIDNIGIYVEEYDALEEDKIKLYDYLYSNGYAFGHIGDIDLYDHTRKYFNYLECDVGTISAPISNREKIRLRDRLKSIRFWHTDYIDYSLENYERWLENG